MIPTIATGTDPTPQAAAQMREAALKFLDTLSADQKTRATFQYMDGERIFLVLPSHESARG